MSKLYVMCGISGSGKSTKAKQILKNNKNCKIISSDELREELLGDVNNQENNSLIFKVMLERTKEYLNKGIDVIYDSTNISSKRRKSLINNFRKHECICVFMYTDIDRCKLNNILRDREVPVEVIENMYKRICVPMWSEGWDDIQFATVGSTYVSNTINDNIIENSRQNYDSYIHTLKILGLEECIELSQDSTYHSLSVSRHMYYSYKKALELTNDKSIILATMLHDIGKPYCKNFKEGNRYANFIGHNNVGAYLMIDKLLNIGVGKDMVIDITTLISLHMRLYDIKDNYKAKEKLIKNIGMDMYKKIEILHNCDRAGH